MSSFILKNREFDIVPNLLLEAAPGFSQSVEFRALTEREQRAPGLVCAAFTNYFLRLQEAPLRGEGGESEPAALEQCYAAIERLASSSDPAVNNLVVVEVFEHIPGPVALESEIKSRLKPRSLALHNRWVH